MIYVGKENGYDVFYEPDENFLVRTSEQYNMNWEVLFEMHKDSKDWLVGELNESLPELVQRYKKLHGTEVLVD